MINIKNLRQGFSAEEIWLSDHNVTYTTHWNWQKFNVDELIIDTVYAIDNKEDELAFSLIFGIDKIKKDES